MHRAHRTSLPLYCITILVVITTATLASAQKQTLTRREFPAANPLRGGGSAQEAEQVTTNTPLPQTPHVSLRTSSRRRINARRRAINRRSNSARKSFAIEGARTNRRITPVAPVAYVNQPHEPEYLYGQAQVTVRGNEDPIIRLGLAQHGPTVVELPASDNFFAVHPGGSFLVTYDQSPTLATDHYLVFRAGKDFVVPPADARRPAEPLASVSVQMQSGMFVTFLFYPVRDISRMAHRCIVMYSREEIIAARRAAGLAVNLNGKDPQNVTPQNASLRVTADANAPAPSASASDKSGDEIVAAGGIVAETQPARLILVSGSDVSGANERRRRGKRKPDLVKEARRALKAALAAPQRFTNWDAATHGLTLAALAPVDLDDRYRLTVIAVRNISTNGLRLVDGQPDLDLETLDDGTRPVQVQPITKIHVETTSLGGSIPAGATAYYALIYEMPTLGAKQRLRLSVAQREAADEPAATNISAANASSR